MKSATLLAGVAVLVAMAGCGSGARQRTPPQPRGIVILVPGSGFSGALAVTARAMRLPPAVWHEWGLRTRVAAYRGGARGLADVGAVLGAVHRSSPRAPVCLYGESSGGTWALVAAAHDPRLRCVVVAAAPTDQETWAQAKSGAARRLARRTWPRYFGSSRLDNALEPYDVWGALRPKVPVLAFYAEGDPVVPAQQGEIFARADPDAEIRLLRRGRQPFVHSRVAAGSLRRETAEVRRFVLRHAGS